MCYNCRALRGAAVARRSQSSSVWFQQAGLLTAIPIVLLVGPLIGYYLGTAAERRWPIAPWGVAAGITLGLLASANVTIDLIRQARNLTRDDNPPPR